MPKPTLLIVDDEENITRSLARSLRDQFTVFTANTGQAALDILARETIDVILTDQRMPGMTGVELLTQARSVSPDSISVIITAYTDVEALTAALNLGNVRGYVPKPWDIELLRQKLLEAALQQSNRFVQQVLDTTPDGIYVYNAIEHRTVYVNQGATALLGYTSAALLQLDGVLLEQLAQAEDAAHVAAQLGRVAVAQDNDVLEIQCRVRHATGDWRWVQSWERVLTRTAAGQPRFIVGTFQDITARKQIEDLQRQATAQRIELGQLKDQFVSRISHELRTPLTSIKIYLELLDPDKPEKISKYLATLRRETLRLQRLIEDLLDLSQIDFAHQPIDLTRVDLNRLTAELVTDRQALADQRAITLRCELGPDLPPVQTDAKLIMQAVSQLLSNALQYTPRGEQVLVSTLRQAVDGADWLTVTVRDTGRGLSAVDRRHLFERFYRGTAAQDYTVPGMGLGLAFCREIMTKLAGRITVESESATNEHGAAFTLWLPIEAAA